MNAVAYAHAWRAVILVFRSRTDACLGRNKFEGLTLGLPWQARINRCLPLLSGGAEAYLNCPATVAY
jgi:hypothetical protein